MAKKIDPKVAEKVMLKAGLKPLEPFNKASYKWKSIHIQCGDIVYPTYSGVKRGRGGCTPCGQLRSTDSKRTPEKVAVAIMLKAGLKPLEPYRSALKPWKCKCLKCGNVVTPQYNGIQQGNGGCRPCSYVKSGLAGRISEKEAKSRLKKSKLQVVGKYKWHDKNDSFIVKCLICKKNSKTSWTSLDKKGRQVGCRTCSRRAASFLQVTEEKHTKILAEHNLEPFGKYTGKNDLITVKCLLCNKRKPIRRAFLLQRKNKMQGCMTCAGAKIADPKKIIKVMKKAKLQPLVPYSGTHKQWKCKCLKCGRTVYPEFNSILRGQGGCIYCAEIGFNYKEPAIVYIITHHQMNSIKIGITNPDSKPDRLKQFQSYGWEIYKKYDFLKGIQAFKVEQNLFKWLRKDLKLQQHLLPEQMPRTKGETETVSADSITVLEIQKKVEELIKGYRNNP